SRLPNFQPCTSNQPYLLLTYALNNALNRFQWFGPFMGTISWTMIPLRKLAGFDRSSSLKLKRPVVEQLAHFRFIGRMWISLAVTPIRFAQDCTSSLNVSLETGRVRRDRSLTVIFARLVRPITASPCVASS